MGSIRHPRAYSLHLKNPHFLPDFYWWRWISSLGFSELSLEFFMYLSLEFLMYIPLIGVLDFSVSGDLSFPLVCFTGNLPWSSFTGFNEIEDPQLPVLAFLI